MATEKKIYVQCIFFCVANKGRNAEETKIFHDESTFNVLYKNHSITSSEINSSSQQYYKEDIQNGDEIGAQ